MKKVIKRISALLFAFMLAFTTLTVSDIDTIKVFAGVFAQNGVTYNWDGTTLTVTGSGTATDEWKRNSATSGAINATHLTIGSGITTIGEEAFSEMRNVTQTTLPSTVQVIDKYAFQNCVSIGVIKGGQGVISVGRYAFRGCTSLRQLGDSNIATENLYQKTQGVIGALDDTQVAPHNTYTEGTYFEQLTQTWTPIWHNSNSWLGNKDTANWSACVPGSAGLTGFEDNWVIFSGAYSYTTVGLFAPGDTSTGGCAQYLGDLGDFRYMSATELSNILTGSFASNKAKSTTVLFQEIKNGKFTDNLHNPTTWYWSADPNRPGQHVLTLDPYHIYILAQEVTGAGGNGGSNLSFSWLSANGHNTGNRNGEFDGGYIDLDWKKLTATYSNAREYIVYRCQGAPSSSAADFKEIYSLDNVLAMDDKTATDKGKPTITNLTRDTTHAQWSASDAGTQYSYFIKVADQYGNELLRETNRVQATIKTGVYYYLYYTDTNSTTNVTWQNGIRVDNPYKTYDNTIKGNWFHVAAVDNAGNLGPTSHIELPGFPIIYDANGGTGVPPTQLKLYNIDLTLHTKDTAPTTRRGYIFLGWKSDAGDWYCATTSAHNQSRTYTKNATATMYAQWQPIEYNIYYDKGLTDDTTTSIAGTYTRATNLQSTGTNRPYYRATYDKDVTFATGGDLKGRSYALTFKPNFPSDDAHGGAATDNVKNSYILTLKKSSNSEEAALQTLGTLNSNKEAVLSGTLPAKKQWVITGADSDNTAAKTVTYGQKLTRPNYKDTQDASCVATAQWKDVTLKYADFAEPQMKGYKFLGWYDSASYTLTPDGKGGFTYSTSAHKIDGSYVKKITPATTKWTGECYAHWMPVMAYLNHSYPTDDGTTGNYTAYTNGHVVNDLNSGYLTKDVHVGTTFWEYAGRNEAAAFFTNNLNNYVKYANMPNPSVYFDIDLHPRTKAITPLQTTINKDVGETTETNDNHRVYMPTKFLNSVFEFTTPSGTRDDLYNASVAAATWTQKPVSGKVTYGGTIGKQADSDKYKYRIYDVWTLEGWYLSNTAETKLDTKITATTTTDYGVYRYDLAAKWNKNSTDIRMPLPKRVLVFELDSEGGIYKYKDAETTKNAILKNIDSADSPQHKLRTLVQGGEVSFPDSADSTGIANVYKPTNTIIANAQNSLVYDFNFEKWVNKDTTTTVAPLGKISTSKNTDYYAKWNLNNDLVLPQLEKEGYIFLGWYTIPQDIIPAGAITDATQATNTGTYGDGSPEPKYWAGGGYEFVDGHLVDKDVYLQKNTCTTIDWDTSTNKQTLYAWFNREPIFVDIYEGLFFEGQDVSLADLKKLVGVFDFEDDYSALALQYIESLPTVEMDSLYLPVLVDKDVNFEVHKSYSDAEIAETIQVQNYEFDGSRWEPYTSAYWQDLAEHGEWQKISDLQSGVTYDELPNSAEEGSTGDITPAKRDIYITNGKLYTPRRTDGVDGVYKSKETGKVYYTAEAKAELAYYAQHTNYVNHENIDYNNSSTPTDSFSNLDYLKYTGLKLKIKSITYKVQNKAPAEEVVEVNVPISSIKDYDSTISQYRKVLERSRYTGATFIDRNKKQVYRPISNWRLDTSTSRIIMSYDNDKKEWTGEGEFDVTYEVTDNGIMFNGVVIENSPITITYTRGCKIQYNKLPQIAIANIVDFTNTSYLNSDAFEDMILRSQTVIDGEDNVNNLPWWTKKKTTPKLVNSLEVVKVNNIAFDEMLLDRYGLLNPDGSKKEAVVSMEGRTFTTLKELYDNYKMATKGSERWRLWQCISNFDVIVDAHDQWGKYASGKVLPNWHTKGDGGDGNPSSASIIGTDGVVVEEIGDSDPKPKQPEEYRTITVILINEDEDMSMNAANVMETVRFINANYISYAKDSLGDTYWGTTGSDDLATILQKHDIVSGKSDKTAADDSYTNKLGRTINIYVEDYTEDN